MKDLLIQIFGSYQPVTYDISDGVTVSTVIAQGFAGVDWPYVLGVLLFGLMIYSLMRIVGVFLK